MGPAEQLSLFMFYDGNSILREAWGVRGGGWTLVHSLSRTFPLFSPQEPQISFEDP